MERHIGVEATKKLMINNLQVFSIAKLSELKRYMEIYVGRKATVADALSERLTKQHALLARLLSPVYTLGLSTRLKRILGNNHIEFIWELIQKTEYELSMMSNFGPASFNNLRVSISPLEFSLLNRYTPHYLLEKNLPFLAKIIPPLTKIEGKLTSQDIQRVLLSLLGTDKELTDQNIQRAIVLTSSINTLILSVRSENVLKMNGIKYILELVRKTERELLQLPNFERKNLNEIKKALSGLGLSLGMEWPLNPRTQEALLARLLSSVHTLELSARSANVLKNNHIESIWELVQKTEKELLQLPNFERKNLNEIKKALSSLGLSLEMSGMGIIDFTWFVNLEKIKREIILPLDPTLIEDLILLSHFRIYSKTLLDHFSFKNPLTSIEEKVMKLRFGIEEEKRHTVREPGQSLNRSLTEVEQIEQSAIEKLFILGKRLGVVKDPISNDQKERKELAELIFQVVLSLERNEQQNSGRVESSPEKEKEEKGLAETDNRYKGQDDKKEPSSILLEAPISILNLPLRSHFALKENSIDYIWQLVQTTENKLSFQEIPKEHINEIKKALSRFDLDLGMDVIKNFIPSRYSPLESMRSFDNYGFFSPMNSREEKVLRMRFGLAEKRYSFSEISEYIDDGYASARDIQRIEKRAFGKLLVQFGKQLEIVEYSVSTNQQRKKEVVELVFKTLFLLSLHRDKQPAEF